MAGGQASRWACKHSVPTSCKQMPCMEQRGHIIALCILRYLHQYTPRHPCAGCRMECKWLVGRWHKDLAILPDGRGRRPAVQPDCCWPIPIVCFASVLRSSVLLGYVLAFPTASYEFVCMYGCACELGASPPPTHTHILACHACRDHGLHRPRWQWRFLRPHSRASRISRVFIPSCRGGCDLWHPIFDRGCVMLG